MVGHLDGSHLMAVGIDHQVHLAPDPALVGPVLPDLPLTPAQHLQPGAVDRKVQRPAAGAVGTGDLEALLSP